MQGQLRIEEDVTEVVRTLQLDAFVVRTHGDIFIGGLEEICGQALSLVDIHEVEQVESKVDLLLQIFLEQSDVIFQSLGVSIDGVLNDDSVSLLIVRDFEIILVVLDFLAGDGGAQFLGLFEIGEDVGLEGG